MKKIELIIRSTQLNAVLEALVSLEIYDINYYNIKGLGLQHKLINKSLTNIKSQDFIDKIKVELIIKSQNLDETIRIIIKSAYCGELGDSKIFVSSIENIYPIIGSVIGNGEV